MRHADRQTSYVVIAAMAALLAILLLGERHAQRRVQLFGADEVAKSLPAGFASADEDPWQVRLPASRNADLVALDVVATAPVVLRSGAATTDVRCRTAQPGRQTCSIALTLGAEPRSVELSAPAAVSIEALEIRPLRRVHQTTRGASGVLVMFVAVLGALPLLWLVFQHRVLSEWLLIGLSGACLWWLHAWFAASLLPFLCIVYVLGTHMQNQRIAHGTASAAKLYLALTLVAAVTFLLGWKYADDVAAVVFANPGGLTLLLPLGVSYFVIRVVDTLLRWYRAELRSIGLRQFLVYVLFPATVPAGPIHTLQRFHQDRLQRVTTEDIAYGAGRIIIGLAQKVVLVDYLLVTMLFGDGQIYAAVLLDAGGASRPQVIALPFLLLLYSYLDFSAYSNIAIGASRLLGYRMVENFNWPIIASSVQEYWKRWHMSLSGWCMRNIYVPFAIKTRSSVVPLYVTMLVVGMWHSLSLPWFLWAMHHASGLALTAAVRDSKPWRRLQRGATLRALLGVPATLTFAAAGYCLAFVNHAPTATNLYVHFWRNLLAL